MFQIKYYLKTKKLNSFENLEKQKLRNQFILSFWVERN